MVNLGDGFFAGGVAKGLQAGQQLSIQQQQVDQQDLQNQVETFRARRTQIHEHVRAVGEGLSNARLAGTLTPEKEKALLQTSQILALELAKTAEGLNTATGTQNFNPQAEVQQIMDLLTLPGAEEKAKGKGRGQAITKFAEAEELELKGVSRDVARAAAGIRKSEGLFGKEGIKFESTPEGGISLSLGGDQPLAREEARNLIFGEEIIVEAENLINEITELPQAVGISGVVADKVGGVIKQITPEGVTQDTIFELINLIPGVRGLKAENISDIKTIRKAGEFFVGTVLPKVTKEVGRYTDTEREIARNASSVLKETDDPETVIKTLQMIIGMVESANKRAAGRLNVDTAVESSRFTEMSDEELEKIFKGK